MRKVAIVGVSSTPRNAEYMRGSDNRSWRDYVVDAAYDAIADVKKGLNPRDLQFAIVNYHGEATMEAGGIGPVVADILGLIPIGVMPLTSNCVGAGVGLHEAYSLVASGRYDRVLVLGFDKWFDILNPADERVLGTDVDYDFQLGYDHPTIQAILQAYAYRKWGRNKVLKTLASYRMQSMYWGNRNPKSARWGVKAKSTKEELFQIIGGIADDAGIPDEFWAKLPGNYSCEGAAAMIVVPADEARAYTDTPVYVEGVSYKCNSHLMSSQMYYPAPGVAQYDMCDFAAVQVAAAEAYAMTGLKPADVEFAELFESHLTSVVPSLAATRVPKPDRVLDFIIDGETGPEGRLPVGTDGGRAGYGLTSGTNFADGVYEAVLQMRGEAGERQLQKTGIAMITGQQGEMGSAAAALLRNGS